MRVLEPGDTIAHEDNGDNYCRYVEQEYVEDEATEDTIWHDWTVELKLGETFVVAHWRAQVGGSPSEWDWCERESEKAFAVASSRASATTVGMVSSRTARERVMPSLLP